MLGEPAPKDSEVTQLSFLQVDWIKLLAFIVTRIFSASGKKDRPTAEFLLFFLPEPLYYSLLIG